LPEHDSFSSQLSLAVSITILVDTDKYI